MTPIPFKGEEGELQSVDLNKKENIKEERMDLVLGFE